MGSRPYWDSLPAGCLMSRRQPNHDNSAIYKKYALLPHSCDICGKFEKILQNLLRPLVNLILNFNMGNKFKLIKGSRQSLRRAHIAVTFEWTQKGDFKATRDRQHNQSLLIYLLALTLDEETYDIHSLDSLIETLEHCHLSRSSIYFGS